MATLPRMANQVCLITGASSGIGRETAQLFLEHGAKGLLLADIDMDGLRETHELCENISPGKTVSYNTDVSEERECEDMIAAAEEEFGKLTVLFNNAGIMHSDDGDETDEDIWDITLAVNVKGVFFGCKHGIPALLRAGGGSIINTSSFVGTVGAATPQIAYTASKGAVSAMTRELAVINARKNIRVNNLCPGPLNTPLLQNFLNTEEKRQKRLVHVPMGRFGEASEMAKAALFLASTESSYITGASLFVDGGITCAYVTPDEHVDPFGGPPPPPTA